MHGLLLNITEHQEKMLKKIKNKNGKPVTVQIRKAIDEYLEKMKK